MRTMATILEAAKKPMQMSDQNAFRIVSDFAGWLFSQSVNNAKTNMASWATSSDPEMQALGRDAEEVLNRHVDERAALLERAKKVERALQKRLKARGFDWEMSPGNRK